MLLSAWIFSAPGFLGTRASLMFDVVVVAMAVILPVLAASVFLARGRGLYSWHKRIQITLGLTLLVAVALFEVEIRIYGWEHLAARSPGERPPAEVYYALWTHLVFAVTTPLLWIAVVWHALRRFDDPPRPNAHSASHRFWGWLAAGDMAATALTGWIFYWLAFVR